MVLKSMCVTGQSIMIAPSFLFYVVLPLKIVMILTVTTVHQFSEKFRLVIVEFDSI